MGEQHHSRAREDWPAWCEAYLTALLERPLHSRAARLAGIEKTAVIRFRQSCPEYREAERAALESHTPSLEGRALDMAMRGVKKRVKKGDDVTMELADSPAHTQWMLARMLPDRYGEKRDDAAAHAAMPTIVLLEPAAVAELQRLRDEVAQLRAEAAARQQETTE